MWNGDVFGGDLIKDEDGGTQSDTEILFRVLESSPSSSVPSVLCKVRGPFAFAYLRPGEGRLWFGRDVLGRHCLLAGGGDKEGFFLSSVAAPEWEENSCVEVPAMGVFEKDMATFKLVLHPWEGLDTDANIEDQGIAFSVAEDSLECPIALPAIEEALPPDKDRDEWIGTALREKWSIHDMVDRFWEEDAQSENHARSFLCSLQEAVRKRVRTRPDYCKECVKKVILGEDLKCGHCKVAVLFSGGLDSTVLAALADRAMEDCPEEQIDLINVAFQMEGGSFEVPDRITARQARKKENPFSIDEQDLLFPGSGGIALVQLDGRQPLQPGGGGRDQVRAGLLPAGVRVRAPPSHGHHRIGRRNRVRAVVRRQGKRERRLCLPCQGHPAGDGG